jgi:hypothetical protein
MQYRCLNQIKYNGVTYQEGQFAEFFGGQAEILLKAGVIERIRKPFEKTDQPLNIKLTQAQ